MMVRIKAHLAATQQNEENPAETITLVVPIRDSRIVGGAHYGEIVEDGERYPFRFENRSDENQTGFYFGHYSVTEENVGEERYKTNLAARRIVEREYFTVVDSSEDEWTYVIDHVIDMGSATALA